jgi:DNA invertase Pin-like site-specific DNA recombinase
MAMIGKVKRMHFREKKSVREIVRLTSLSRNTVRKWLKTPVLEEPKLPAQRHTVQAHAVRRVDQVGVEG